ncbi:MAG: hypothetical protein WC882_03520 [Candidatus Gracilibacteria bacterium]
MVLTDGGGFGPVGNGSFRRILPAVSVRGDDHDSAVECPNREAEAGEKIATILAPREEAEPNIHNPSHTDSSPAQWMDEIKTLVESVVTQWSRVHPGFFVEPGQFDGMACLYINYREPSGQGVNWHCACIPTTINHSYYIFELGQNLQGRYRTNHRASWLAADEEIRAQLRPVCQAIETFLVEESKRRDAPGEDVKDKERERFRPDYTRSPLAENPVVADTCIFPDGVNPHELEIDDLKRYLGAAFKVFRLQFFEKYETDGYDILNENRSGNLILALRWGSKNSSYLETTCASIQKTQKNPECWEITTAIPVGARKDWGPFFEAVKAEFDFAQRASIGERMVDTATPAYFKPGEDLQNIPPEVLLVCLNEALGEDLREKRYHFKDTSDSAGRRTAISEDPSLPEQIEALWLLQNVAGSKPHHYGYVNLRSEDERSGRRWYAMGSPSTSFSASGLSFKEIGPFIKQLTAALDSSPKKAGQRASATASPEAPRPTVSVENISLDPGKLQTISITSSAPKPADPATPHKKQTMSKEAFLRSLSRGR